MRIAYVSTYPPTECGIATYTQYLSDAVKEKGNEIRILSQKGAYGKNTFEVYAPDDKDIASKLFFYVERLTPDVVHIEHEFGLFGDQRGVQIVEFLIRCKLIDTPVVTTMHTVFEDLKHSEQIIVQHILNLSSVVIVHEEFQKEILEEKYECKDNIVVIPHGVRDVPVINNAKEKLALTGKKVLLLAGYIRSTKNFEKIIYLLPELIKRNKDLVLLMAARSRINEYSDYKEKLYKSIEPYISSGHVKVLYGKFPQETLDTILSAADLLALPYEKGAQSGVLAQASAMLLPVITSDLLSFKNWIDDVKGGLYAKSDIDYISKITQILSDKDLRLELIQNIKNSNLKRNWNSIAEDHIKLYKEQLKAPVMNAEFFYVKPKENKYVNC